MERPDNEYGFMCTWVPKENGERRDAEAEAGAGAEAFLGGIAKLEKQLHAVSLLFLMKTSDMIRFHFLEVNEGALFIRPIDRRTSLAAYINEHDLKMRR